MKFDGKFDEIPWKFHGENELKIIYFDQLTERPIYVGLAESASPPLVNRAFIYVELAQSAISSLDVRASTYIELAQSSRHNVSRLLNFQPDGSDIWPR